MSVLDTPVRDAVWAAIDFESTGARPGLGDEPVQVGIAVADGDRGTPGRFLRSYLRPAAGVTRTARAVHGIGEAETRDAPALADLWGGIRERLSGAVVVAHGAGTEKRFLRAFPLHGFGPWLDTLALARAVFPNLPEHSLSDVVKAAGVEPEVRALCPGLDWHDALFDAVACLVFLRAALDLAGWQEAVVGQILALDSSAYHRRRGVLRTARDAGWLG